MRIQTTQKWTYVIARQLGSCLPYSLTFLQFLFLLLSSPLDVMAAEVGLTWDPNSEPDLAGYKLYRREAGGSTDWTLDVGLATSAQATGLIAGRTYCFVVTASNTSGLESDPSNEVCYTVPDANQPPTANGTVAVVAEDTEVQIFLSGTDPDGDALTFQVATPPTSGVLLGSPPNLTYRPNPNFNGADSFRFTV